MVDSPDGKAKGPSRWTLFAAGISSTTTGILSLWQRATGDVNLPGHTTTMLVAAIASVGAGIALIIQGLLNGKS